jgi:hypothetical protein
MLRSMNEGIGKTEKPPTGVSVVVGLFVIGCGLLVGLTIIVALLAVLRVALGILFNGL